MSARAAAGAGLLALLAAGSAPGGSGERACPEPRETRALASFTTAVSCAEGDGGSVRGPALLLFGERLDLNRAAPAALEALPGVGPGRAAAIARERCLRPFERVEDLIRTPGVGPRTLAAVREQLTVAARPGGTPPRGPVASGDCAEGRP